MGVCVCVFVGVGVGVWVWVCGCGWVLSAIEKLDKIFLIFFDFLKIFPQISVFGSRSTLRFAIPFLKTEICEDRDLNLGFRFSGHVKDWPKYCSFSRHKLHDGIRNLEF